MFAVIRTGGKQYKVVQDDVIEVEKLIGDAGGTITFGEVLMLGGDSPKSGAPLIDGASVVGEIVEQGRHPKVIAFMKKLPDGSFETNRVSVGRDGLTPPM